VLLTIDAYITSSIDQRPSKEDRLGMEKDLNPSKLNCSCTSLPHFNFREGYGKNGRILDCLLE
jgi:hypothetical protein